MKYKKLHCWDCGTQIIDEANGKHALLPNFQQVRFNLSNGSYMENPFCRDCAARPWGASRLEEYRQAVATVVPAFNSIAITQAVGPTTPGDIAGVV